MFGNVRALPYLKCEPRNNKQWRFYNIVQCKLIDNATIFYGRLTVKAPIPIRISILRNIPASQHQIPRRTHCSYNSPAEAKFAYTAVVSVVSVVYAPYEVWRLAQPDAISTLRFQGGGAFETSQSQSQAAAATAAVVPEPGGFEPSSWTHTRTVVPTWQGLARA